MHITPAQLEQLLVAGVKAEASLPPFDFWKDVHRDKTAAEIALRDITERLSEDERMDILALMWLGLDKGFETFETARAQIALEPDLAHAICSRSNRLVSSILGGLMQHTLLRN